MCKKESSQKILVKYGVLKNTFCIKKSPVRKFERNLEISVKLKTYAPLFEEHIVFNRQSKTGELGHKNTI